MNHDPYGRTKSNHEMTAISSRSPFLRGVVVASCAATVGLLLAALFAGTASAADYGIDQFDGAVANADGSAYTQAGGHPYQVSTAVTVERKTDQAIVDQFGVPPDQAQMPNEPIKDINVDLPPGLVGNPAAIPKCTADQLLQNVTFFDQFAAPACPIASQVGWSRIRMNVENIAPFWGFPVYNMVPPPGAPARFGLLVSGVPIFLDAQVRSDGSYGLTIAARDIPVALRLWGSEFTFWGIPADPRHDTQRCEQGGFGWAAPDYVCSGDSGTPLGPHSIDSGPVAFISNPTACTPAGEGLVSTVHSDSWDHPGVFDTATFESHLPPGYPADEATWGPPQGPTGCESVPFAPDVNAQPTTTNADTPSGLEFGLDVPQDGLTNPSGLATAHLKRAEITLPEGMAVNPSSANGLGACSPAQIALNSAEAPSCPDSSKLGTVKIDTPLLDDPLEGNVFLAKQGDNPFNSTLALYLNAAGSGIQIKLPGKISPDPDTGRLTATFDDNPQLPFSHLDVTFKGGDRAPLVAPSTCGQYEITTQLTPWSAADPDHPTADEIVTKTSSFTIDHGSDGGPCLAGDPSQPGDPADLAARPFAPALSAGLVDPVAGGSSPFVLKITRPDGNQEIKSISADLPPGLVAHLAGVPRCSDTALASIDQAEGTGQDEIDNPSCPAGSLLGTAKIGAGAGNQPYYVQTGKVYLAGAYKGAPYSLAIVTPAVAGPLDLGTVVVRSKLEVDPDDAQVHVVSDEIPQILAGIPLRIRDIRVRIDRPGFIQAPTNCNPMQVASTVAGSNGAVANLSNPFQVAGCGALGFSPRLSGAILNGAQGIHRSAHPNLQFNLHPTPGDANLSRVEVLLPQSFQIDQANLGNICSETELATNECAGRNTIGTASARTPLLDSTLSGPVYAVSGSGGLPKLAVILNGPPVDPVHLLVRGITDTVGARIRNTFPLVPDTPITDFTLTLNGGPAGYLVDNTDVCNGTGTLTKKQNAKLKKIHSKQKRQAARKRMLRGTGLNADALFTAQDGDTLSQAVPIAAQCPKAKKSKKSSHRRRH